MPRSLYMVSVIHYVDHDFPLPATTPLRVRVDGGDHLIVGFAASLVVCQYIDSFPQVLCTRWPFRRITFPLCHVLPELERLINASHSPPPLFTRRPRTAYGSSNFHDTNDTAPACGIDGLHKSFRSSH